MNPQRDKGRHPLAGLFLVLAVATLFPGSVPGAAELEPATADKVQGQLPSPHQDSIFLYRMTSAAPVPDGLLRLGLGYRFYGITFNSPTELLETKLRDYLLRLEYGILPALHLAAELPYRTWNQGVEPFEEKGSGLGDGTVRLRWNLPAPASLMSWALWAGTSVTTGQSEAGLSEGEASREMGVAVGLRFWVDSDIPEMRLHLNAGLRANGNETTGYGVGLTDGLEPWFPLYPAVPEGGKNRDNDFLLLGAAVEFRRETTTLFVEYTETRLHWAEEVANREYQRMVSGGLRWGKVGGWAIEMGADVSLARNHPDTGFPAADSTHPYESTYPDLTYRLVLSRQFSLGGQDRDHDGIPDRIDQCPGQEEDRDGFADGDGCPDLDNDQDGIFDGEDGAPDHPEDFDGFEDQDGIPDPDNDGDGFPDERDDCPDQPEDFDGHNDDDGCPDEFMDIDGDGIEDDRDRCPEIPEDPDGFEDGDGCPEIDNDLDGIEDSLDQCPDEPEDYNGQADDDGCPDGQEPAEPSASP